MLANPYLRPIWAVLSFCLCLPLLLNGCARPDSSGLEASMLTIKGSDTMLHLVNAWAESYMAANPDADMSINGGGSGTGIAALINGTTDICMSSRDINVKERELAEAQGVAVEEIAVGQDGLAIAIHPENPVESLTREQLEKIFSGAYTRWSEVGGPDEAIIVLSRESSSGTYVFFQEFVLNKKDFASSARLLPATNAIIQAVSTDKWAIGYVGLGYAAEAAEGIKVLSIAATPEETPVAPSSETVLSGEYPIARELYFYAGTARSNLAQSFIDYCLSEAGQEIVKEAGYVPVS